MPKSLPPHRTPARAMVRLAGLAAAVLTAGLLTACGSNSSATQADGSAIGQRPIDDAAIAQAAKAQQELYDKIAAGKARPMRKPGTAEPMELATPDAVAIRDLPAPSRPAKDRDRRPGDGDSVAGKAAERTGSPSAAMSDTSSATGSGQESARSVSAPAERLWASDNDPSTNGTTSRLSNETASPTSPRASRAADAPTASRTKLVQEYSRELSALLELEAAGKRSAISQAVTLAVLAAIEPGAADRLSTLRGRLDDEQLHIVDAIAKLADAAKAASSGAPASASGSTSLTTAMLEAAAKLDEQRGLQQPTLGLATKVESFGRYTPVQSNRFAMGKRSKFIVYTELRNFSNGKGAGSETVATGDSVDEGSFSVELRQELDLRVESDGTTALNLGVQEMTSRSRTPRRDLFLTKTVELPPTLPVGKYVLRSRVTDLHTGAVAEAKYKLEVGG